MRYWLYVEKRMSTTVVVDAPDLPTALRRLPDHAPGYRRNGGFEGPDVDEAGEWEPVAVTDEDGNDIPVPAGETTGPYPVPGGGEEQGMADKESGRKKKFRSTGARIAHLREHRERVGKKAAAEKKRDTKK